MPRTLVLVLVLATLSLNMNARGGEPELPPLEVKQAVTQGLALIRKAAANYPAHRTCFSCHHQTLPMLAMVSAQGGRRVDRRDAAPGAGRFQPRIVPGQARRDARGQGGRRRRDDRRLRPLGSSTSRAGSPTTRPRRWWPSCSRPSRPTATGRRGRRPPLEESVADGHGARRGGPRTRSHPHGSATRPRRPSRKAQAWLAKAPMKEQEDRNIRALGPRPARGATRPTWPSAVASVARHAARRRRLAVATTGSRATPTPPARPSRGSTTPACPPTDPAYQRGMRYLLEDAARRRLVEGRDPRRSRSRSTSTTATRTASTSSSRRPPPAGPSSRCAGVLAPAVQRRGGRRAVSTS